MKNIFNYCGCLLRKRTRKYKKLNDWLYLKDYKTLEYNYAWDKMNETYHNTNVDLEMSGCSAVAKDNLFGKNLDWTYNYGVDFIIRTPHTIGVVGAIPNITRENIEKGNIDYRMLPFQMNNGINDEGLYVALNMVTANDTKNGEIFAGVTTGTHDLEKRDTCTLMIPRLVLDNFYNPEDAIEFLKNECNIYSPGLPDHPIEAHFLIGKVGGNCYVVEFIHNELKATKLEEYKYMTNYYVYETTFNDGIVNYTTTTDYATGLARGNDIAKAYNSIRDIGDMAHLMRDTLKYTRTYRDKCWLDEFAGVYPTYGDLPTRKAFETPSDFDGIWEYGHNSFLTRVRGETDSWQTEHSVTYDLAKGKMQISVQEMPNVYYVSIKK